MIQFTSTHPIHHHPQTEEFPPPTQVDSIKTTFQTPHSLASKRYPMHRWSNTFPIGSNATSTVVIDPDDPILLPGKGWDASPIVLENFRLLFFTTPKVGTTVFKKLFRRMMDIPLWPLEDINIPHNPQWNGLKYLYDYSPDQVHEILTSPNWTRAVFVRDPLERVLSAYLDKAVRHNGTYVKRHCCGIKDDKGMPLTQLQDQRDQIRLQFQQQQQDQQHNTPMQRGSNLFLLTNSKMTTTTNISTTTHPKAPPQERRRRRRLQAMDMRVVNRLRSDAALQALLSTDRVARPQSVPEGASLPTSCSNFTTATLISWQTFVNDILGSCSEDPHWKSQVISSLKWINFVGHFETLQSDTQRLLEQIGAWELYGAQGWPGGDGRIFQGNNAQHKTSSRQHITRYYADVNLRQKVLQFYLADYDNPILNLTPPKW